MHIYSKLRYLFPFFLAFGPQAFGSIYGSMAIDLTSEISSPAPVESDSSKSEFFCIGSDKLQSAIRAFNENVRTLKTFPRFAGMNRVIEAGPKACAGIPKVIQKNRGYFVCARYYAADSAACQGEPDGLHSVFSCGGDSSEDGARNRYDENLRTMHASQTTEFDTVLIPSGPSGWHSDSSVYRNEHVSRGTPSRYYACGIYASQNYDINWNLR